MVYHWREVYVASEKEASIAMFPAQHAQEVTLLCDASKLEKKPIYNLPLRYARYIDYWCSADKALSAQYEQKGLKIIG